MCPRYCPFPSPVAPACWGPSLTTASIPSLTSAKLTESMSLLSSPSQHGGKSSQDSQASACPQLPGEHFKAQGFRVLPSSCLSYAVFSLGGISTYLLHQGRIPRPKAIIPPRSNLANQHIYWVSPWSMVQG